MHPPLVPGGELGSGGWAAWTTGYGPLAPLHQVFEDPNQNSLNVDVDSMAATQDAFALLPSFLLAIGSLTPPAGGH